MQSESPKIPESKQQAPKLNPIEKLTEKLADIMLLHPWKLISGFVFMALVLILFLPQLKSDYGVRIWFRTTDPLLKDLDQLEQKFGNDESVVIAINVLDPNDERGIFTPERIHVIQELTEQMWLLPEVVRVDSLVNFNYSTVSGDEIQTEAFLKGKNPTAELLAEKKKIATSHEILSDQFVSKDGRTAILSGQLRPDIKGSPDYQLNVEAMNKMMAPYEARAKELGISFHYVGASNVNDAYRTVSENDIKVMMPINLLLMVIFLFFVFRTIDAFLVPLALVLLTILMTFGTSALVGYKFDNLSAAIPGILIATCMADSIHILAAYYRARRNGIGSKEAMRETLKKNLLPTFLTSITTAIGFFTLTTTELLPVKNMTLLAGIGVMYAWFLTIFVIVPLLPKLPYRAFRFKEQTKFSFQKAVKITEFLNEWKIPIFMFFTISTVILGAVGAQNSVNSDPLKHFSPDLKITRDSNFLLEKFGGLSGPQIIVDSGAEDGIKNPEFLKQVELFMAKVRGLPDVNKLSSITPIIKELNQKLHQDNPAFYTIPESREAVAEILLLYSMGLPQGMDLNNQVTLDNRYLRLGLMWNILDAERSIKQIDEIYAIAKTMNLNITVTGKIVLYHRMIFYIVETFFKSMALALLMIGGIMTLSLGSWRLGILSMLPNLMPLAFGAAIMYWLKYPIDIGTSLVMSVCMGIAVDDTIHFLTDYKEKIKTSANIEDTIAHVFSDTAPSLIFTTVILTLCFGVFVFCDFVPNINFGILCSVVLTMALACDLIFLPVILLIFRVK